MYGANELIIIGIIVVIVLLVIGIPLYFLPVIIAYNRKHTNRSLILLLDFLVGWTFIGWAGCLVWAFIDNNESVKVNVNNTNNNNTSNKYEDLEKLMQLKESGALTDVEYEIEKAKILK